MFDSFFSCGFIRATVTATGEQDRGVWRCGSTTLLFLPTSRTKMNYLLNKKSKKSLKYSQRDIFLGIPTNIAAGPLGFRAELDIGPNGEQSPIR